MRTYIGQELGPYRLTRLLGQGGFAEVYLGEHLLLSTQAAIKIHHARLEETHFKQFEQEARLIASLTHAHIVRVLDYGVQDGVAYLVMDYAAHGTLRQLHPEGTVLPLETVVAYVKQVASALQYAHDRRVVHRDVKPENMLVSAQQHILLSDFGIAVTVSTTRSLGTQDAIGTVSYMAPEQLRKRARPASDQYSLATIAYEWLCGAPPFDGLPIEVALQHITDPIPSLREKLPELPLRVEQVLLRALSKEPEQRFPAIQAFADALELAARECVEETVIRAQEEPSIAPNAERAVERRSAPAGKFWPERRRKDPAPRAKVVLNTALLLLVVLGVGIAGTLGVSHLVTQPGQHAHVSLTAFPTVSQNPILPLETRPGDWIERGFDAQDTGYNPYEHILRAQNVSALKQLWKVKVKSDFHFSVGMIPSFVVSQRMLYFVTRTSIFVTNAQNRQVRELGKLPAEYAGLASRFTSSPTLAGGHIYLSDGSNLADFDIQSGTFVQIGTFGPPVGDVDPYVLSSPVTADGMIYNVAMYQAVYMVDPQTRHILWQTRLPDITSSPAVADGLVYVAGLKYLYALDAHTGRLLWQSQEVGNGGSGQSGVADGIDWGLFTPVVGSRFVYVTTGNELLAFPLQCTSPCSPAWSDSFKHVFRSSPSFANGVVYANTASWSSGNQLLALGGTSGHILWSASSDPVNPGPIIAPLIIAGNVVYTTNYTGMPAAFAANGCGAALCKPLWSLVTSLSMREIDLLATAQTVRVSNGVLYAFTFDGYFWAFGLSQPG